ncbi:MAG TPA: dihydropteroate synthase [Verrucomicrobiae bacterium]|nr:dihydropteroate synthase [Verrucomicrobiae bacterium]
MNGPFQWDTRRTLIMGVLNVTPDSFSDGGKFLSIDLAVEHAREMARAGADIIDVGGESTRPGAAPVSAEEEVRRVLPVIERLRDLVVSVDTTKASVAERALEAGARIINDISALRFDPLMVEVACNAGAGVVLMHMQGTPQTMQQDPQYDDVVAEVRSFLAERIVFAESHGLKKSQIAVDPGIGFGKTVAHNLQILARLDEFSSLGCPLLVGTSRKSFIGKLLAARKAGPGHEPLRDKTDGRLWGTAATVAWAVAQGAGIMRVHDVAEMTDVIRMVEAVKQAR